MSDLVDLPFFGTVDYATAAMLVGGAVVVGFVTLKLVAFLVGGSVRSTLLNSVPRRNVVLIGLPGAGKTSLLLKLADAGARDPLKSQTSMEPNITTVRVSDSKELTLVDCPGHQRLRHKLFDAVEAATTVVVVVDSVTIQDDHTQGAQALAGLLFDVLQSKAFYGVKKLVIACSKGDEITSFSSKAVRRYLEAEMGRTIATRAGAVGTLRGEIKRNVRGATQNSSLCEEGILYLSEDTKKFSFDTLNCPVTFVDCSVTNPSKLVEQLA